MKQRILVMGLLCLVFLQAIAAQADEVIEILGMKIPVIEGAEQVKETEGVSVKGHIVTFTVEKSLGETMAYEPENLIGRTVNVSMSNLTGNLRMQNFLIIGGMESDGSFNAAAKKGDTQFSLLIYGKNGHTQIQFVW